MPSTRTALIHGLYLQHQGQLYRAALRFGAAQADAEDLVQATFLIAHQQIDSLRSETSGAAWLRAILYNLWRNHLRKRARRSTSSVDNLDIIALPASDRAFFNALTSELLAPLDDNKRTMVLLRYAGGMTYRELGAHLQLREHVVYDRVRRAREEIRRHANA